jgi:hypothetical protein
MRTGDPAHRPQVVAEANAKAADGDRAHPPTFIFSASG